MRFSLKTFILTLLVVGVVLVSAYQWYTYPQRHFQQVQESLTAIGKGRIEAAVLYDAQVMESRPPYHVDNLLELHFEDTNVQDSDLAHVKVLDPENLLSLSNTSITDAGLTHLYGLRVKKIVLSGTNVTAEGIAALKGKLPESTAIEY